MDEEEEEEMSEREVDSQVRIGPILPSSSPLIAPHGVDFSAPPLPHPAAIRSNRVAETPVPRDAGFYFILNENVVF